MFGQRRAQMLIISRAVQGVAAGELMTLAVAAVGDLVSPRERGRYQGYIAATFAVATVAGPLIGGLLVDHASWRWVFYVNLPLGALALAGLSLRLPASTVEPPGVPLDVTGAALLASATSALMLACIWGGQRYAWSSPVILALIALTVSLAGALIVRERRTADPIVPLDLLRSRVVAVASVGLFLATAALLLLPSPRRGGWSRRSRRHLRRARRHAPRGRPDRRAWAGGVCRHHRRGPNRVRGRGADRRDRVHRRAPAEGGPAPRTGWVVAAGPAFGRPGGVGPRQPAWPPLGEDSHGVMTCRPRRLTSLGSRQ